MPLKQRQTKAGRQYHQQPYRPKGVKKRDFHKVYWPYIPLIALCSLGLVLSSLSGSPAGASRPSQVLAYATNMSVSGLLGATNVQRVGAGSKALTINGKLNAAAQAKANDMAARNYWSHNTPDGNPPWVFVEAQDYLYQKLGENLAAGFSDEAATITGWMNSPSHKANLLDSDFSDVGFGFANHPNYVAGGQPMTVVVAFYGRAQVIPGPFAAPTVPAPEKPAAQAPAPAAKPAAQPVVKEPTNETAAPAAKAPDSPQPATSTSPASTTGVTVRQTQAQLALRSTPLASMATGFVAVVATLLAGFWLSRHAVRLRGAIVAGENFVIHHPLVDVILLSCLAFLYLLTQTAGFIK